jgi:hypothetical protein
VFCDEKRDVTQVTPYHLALKLCFREQAPQKEGLSGLGSHAADPLSTLAVRLAPFASTRQAFLAALLSKDIQ